MKSRSWSDLFKRNRTCAADTTLKLLCKQDGRAKLVMEDVDSMEETMCHCLVGHFLGWFPGWKAVKQLTARWKAPHNMLTHNSLWLVFKFSTKELSDAVLTGRPYIAYGCPLYLKALPPCLTFQPEAQNQIPLWMQIYGLPLDCWSTFGLSKATSQIDTPLYTDRYTKARERLNYGRVLVEVNITKPLPTTIAITLSDGHDTDLSIKFDSNLKLC